ncbi:MAG: IPT/TIG domain-containing protein, partial [Actinobacteria bacterium]|nr:IPT/TIG domain-containing protein [Actinomycetota bacterium]
MIILKATSRTRLVLILLVLSAWLFFVFGGNALAVPGIPTLPTPTITSVVPNTGDNSTTTNITINGTNFASAATAKIGSTNLTNVVWVNPNTINATVPAGLATGIYNISVVNPGNITGTLNNAFTVTSGGITPPPPPGGGDGGGGTPPPPPPPPGGGGGDTPPPPPGVLTPTITSVVPNTGDNSTTTNITINGTNFASGANAKIGNINLTNVVWLSDATITATVPSSLSVGVYDISVVNPGDLTGTLNNAFTVTTLGGSTPPPPPGGGILLPKPVVISVSPDFGKDIYSTNVTITGSNFSSSAKARLGNSYYLINVVYVNSTTLTATVPAGLPLGTYDLYVINPGGVSGILKNGYTVIDPPPVQSNVNNVSDNTEADENAADHDSLNSSNQGDGSSGANMNSSSEEDPPVIILPDIGTSILPKPVVKSVSPNVGENNADTEIVISGTGFSSWAKVKLNEIYLDSTTWVNANTIYATVPAGLPVGIYDVSVINPGNLKGTLVNGFKVVPPNQPPAAYIDSINPSPAIYGESVLFTGHGEDSDGTIIGWNWRSSVDGDLSNSASFNTASLSAGLHTIYFKVQDDDGIWSDEVSVILNVNQKPQAVIDSSTPNPANQDTPVAFTGHGTDTDGTIAEYSWNFGDGATSTAQNPSHAYANPGTYTVSFRVRDNDGAWSETITTEMLILNLAPQAIIDSSTPNPANQDTPVNFTSHGTDTDGTIVEYSWNFGDGSTSTAQNPSHAYANPGTYTVSFKVKDNDGAWSSEVTTQVIVQQSGNVPPPPPIGNPTVTNVAPNIGNSSTTTNITIT